MRRRFPASLKLKPEPKTGNYLTARGISIKLTRKLIKTNTDAFRVEKLIMFFELDQIKEGQLKIISEYAKH